MFPVNTIIAWIINYYHKHEYANKPFLLLPLGHIPNRGNPYEQVFYLVLFLVQFLVLVWKSAERHKGGEDFILICYYPKYCQFL